MSFNKTRKNLKTAFAAVAVTGITVWMFNDELRTYKNQTPPKVTIDDDICVKIQQSATPNSLRKSYERQSQNLRTNGHVLNSESHKRQGAAIKSALISCPQ